MGRWSQFFICDDFCEKAHAMNENVTTIKFQKKNYMNELHVELGHPLEVITSATEKL